MKTYRVCVLGCGPRGKAAARAYHSHPRTDLVGLCDVAPEPLAAVGDELDVAARFADADEMIRQTGPDIVVIPTGTHLHYELAMQVMEHGVHIDVEKPMCVDLDQADAMIAKAREKDVRIAVHHQRRAGGTFRAVRQAIREGRIGDVTYLAASGKGYYGGYGLMNIGTHTINDFLGLVGHCRAVTALATTDGRPVTPHDVVPSPQGMGTIAGEHITATLYFDNHVPALLCQHRFAPVDSAMHRTDVCGTEGRIAMDVWGARWSPQPGDEPAAWEPIEPALPESCRPPEGIPPDEYGYVAEFVAALDEGREHECGGLEGHHIVEIMMGIFEAAAYDTRVDLPQQRRDHPLRRWRREHGLDHPEPMPYPYVQWLAAEDKRLGRTDDDPHLPLTPRP